jgi:hypothetical protein
MDLMKSRITPRHAQLRHIASETPIRPGRGWKIVDRGCSGGFCFLSQSPITPSAIGQASGTRIERDSLVEQATASSPNYPISNLQCLFLSPIRREFQLPANRAFIG